MSEDRDHDAVVTGDPYLDLASAARNALLLAEDLDGNNVPFYSLLDEIKKTSIQLTMIALEWDISRPPLDPDYFKKHAEWMKEIGRPHLTATGCCRGCVICLRCSRHIDSGAGRKVFEEAVLDTIEWMINPDAAEDRWDALEDRLDDEGKRLWWRKGAFAGS